MSTSPDAPAHVMVFDLSQHAHLPSYLQFLIESWCSHDLPGQLTIVVWPSFLTRHTDVVLLAERAPRRNIHFVTLSQAERQERIAARGTNAGLAVPFHHLLSPSMDAPYAALYDWNLLCRYATQLRVTHIFIVSIDQYLPLLATGVTVPTSLSGIYFGPTFHHRPPAGDAPLPSTGQAPHTHMRDSFVLARTLRHPDLHTLFFLDAFAVEQAQKFTHGDKATFVPDPARLDSPSVERVTALRDELGIEPHRRIFLLFGQLTRRKGLDQLLAAVRQLPPESSRRICVVVAGSVDSHYREHIEEAMDAITAVQPIQMVRKYGYVPQTDVPAYFQLADVVLAPYVHHDGMSGIVLLAAVARKPILSCDNGLMGTLTRGYKLGLTVNTEQPSEIAAALSRFVLKSPETLYDREGMTRLADQHHADRFGATIWQHIM